MTKKELLDCKWFKEASDDTQIVFKTCDFLAACEPLKKEHIWFMSQATNAQGIPPSKEWRTEPLVLKAIVIDAMPYDVLENVYNIKIIL